MSYDPSPQSTIEVKASYFVLAFLLALFKPQASIDGGQPFPIRWGVTPVPVPPGRHRVDVWLPYLFFPRMGRNGTEVDVPAGGAVQVHWRSPWLVFLQGKITVQQAEGLPSGAPQGGYAPQAGGYPPQAGGYPDQAGGWGQQPAAGAPTGGPFGAAPTAAPAAAAAPGGWHPDPSGRHQQRYFDGAAWTEHVVDDGNQSTDPLGS